MHMPPTHTVVISSWVVRKHHYQSSQTIALYTYTVILPPSPDTHALHTPLLISPYTHIVQSLVVLDYLIKSGNERVSLQCKENMFSIQTLKDFQFIDKDGKDQGANGNVVYAYPLIVACVRPSQQHQLVGCVIKLL